MKNKLVKIVTISSLVLIVTLFSVIMFHGINDNNQLVFVAENNNFKKMDNNTFLRFDDAFKLKESIDNNDSKTIENLVDIKEEVIASDSSSDTLVKEEAKEVNSNTSDDNSVAVIVTPENDSSNQDNSDTANTNTVSLEEEREVLQTVTGTLTGYGPDCVGCVGKTSTGFNLNESIYYEDNEFGTVRILAADPSFPFYSIIRISNVPGMDSFLGIVLDRGGNVGYGRGTLFDLAFNSESDPNLIPLTRNVTFELLRSGK